MKILILGGYGVFGSRLAQLLGDCERVELLIAGRNIGKARAFCDQYDGRPHAKPLALDRADTARALVEHRPDLVVDASGPFQVYGERPYRVVEACIEHSCDYIDLADGAGFVCGIRRFDEAAKVADVFALSGASTCPVLTAAVVRRLGEGMNIREIEAGIAPSPHAGVGLNVMRAVASYAGSPVTLTRNGRETTAPGLAESRRFTVAVPGHLPLRSIRFSLVDVPDLTLLPAENKELSDIWIGAGPTPEILHRLLNLLAKARSLLRLPPLVPLAPIFHRVLDLARFGEHRGGMFVRVKGERDSESVERSWHLIAEGDAGPFIPSMAAAAVIRKMLAGERPTPGARPATGAIKLVDYEPQFAARGIVSGMRDDLESAPIYRKVLGSAFERLPEQVRALHDCEEDSSWSGTAEVVGSSGPLARLIAAVVGFPRPAKSVPVTVTFTRDGEGELWTRRFGLQTFHSHQSLGQGRNARLIVERFGPIAVALALVVKGEGERARLTLIPRRWSAFGVPMPRFLLPRGTMFETQEDGRFVFDVEIKVPLAGRVVAYRGKLMPDARVTSRAQPATLQAT